MLLTTPHKPASLAVLSLCYIKELFHFLYSLLVSTGGCWFLMHPGWCMPTFSAQSKMLCSPFNCHPKYSWIFNVVEIPPGFPVPQKTPLRWNTSKLARWTHLQHVTRKALKGNIWKRKKAELFDQRRDWKSSQMESSRLTVVDSRPWPRGGGRVSRGSCQCSLVFCHRAHWFLQWHIAPHHHHLAWVIHSIHYNQIFDH